MSISKTVKIGFILTPGCREADIVELDALFRLHPMNKVYYVAEQLGMVYGSAQLRIEANTSYDSCPNVDILVVGEVSSAMLENEKLLHFVQRVGTCAKDVIAISNGVQLLHKVGLLNTHRVTADYQTREILRDTDLNVLENCPFTRDGKFVTARPSTGAIEAGFSVLKKWRGEWLAKFVEFTLEYSGQKQYPRTYTKPIEANPLKVGVFIAPDLYVPDIMGAVDVFSALSNVELYYVGPQKGASHSFYHMGPTVETTCTYDTCPQLDVLVIGAVHPRYLNDIALLDFILDQEPEAQAIISVCAGTFVVGATGLLRGKHATTNYHQINDLPLIGVCSTDDKIAVDGKFYSSGPAVGSYEVALKVVEKTQGVAWASYIENHVLEFSPQPLFGSTPHQAERSIILMSNVLSKFLSWIFRSGFKKSKSAFN